MSARLTRRLQDPGAERLPQSFASTAVQRRHDRSAALDVTRRTRTIMKVLLLLTSAAVLSSLAPTLGNASIHRAAEDPRRVTQIPPTVTISAVGDVMLGVTPVLPSDHTNYFSAVRPALTDGAQIVFGNLEGTLTTAGTSKCGTASNDCYAFRAPPSYVSTLKSGGFTILNDANNHFGDFGPAGEASTLRALRTAHLAQSGLPNEITIVPVGKLRVAFVAFAPYSDVNDLLDTAQAQALIGLARKRADLVVVYMHVGAEGANAEHVSDTTEYYLGEDRGNPVAFSHMAIDAGADLVIASGPHVLRGLQLYRGHLIAYSLGNFAGFHNFALGGSLSTSCILRTTLSAAGKLVSARVVPVQLVGAGQPVLGGQAVALLAKLSAADFGTTAARISRSGVIDVDGE
jgi:poly-gamma-glutamate capsule biosynthesis protein CapA/YwtB (metallophosphatase superfamily)